MDRRKRAAVGVESVESSYGQGSCAVCGASDARVLTMVELSSRAAVTLCGSHALMHARAADPSATVEELRARLADRRESDRRAQGEGDELAERLTAAFTRDRRSVDRRAN